MSFNHPLAANRTMSWPCFGVGPRRAESLISHFLGRLGANLTAENCRMAGVRLCRRIE
jgi:hypothetical protein